ncbi:hypothetical protein AKO1_007818 [Acrasis kona]|uniref:tRNA (guanine-N(7)-)-methyltransferase n=1 Tax=Acrasis kona TaxID=1008807 RepID=A0AAW2YNX0_9EUKA
MNNGEEVDNKRLHSEMDDTEGNEKKHQGKKPKWSRFPIRSRAHRNPLNDESAADYPVCPSEVDWKAMYPQLQSTDKVEILDVGCAYGGLITSIAPVAPQTLILGAEIRARVSEFTQSRINQLREEKPEGHHYNNVWAIRLNAMKYLPNYFKKNQLQKIFFMFPDPHFKNRTFRRRIIQSTLIAEYAYILSPGGMIYTITDVQELGEWMQKHLDEHPLFDRVPEGELVSDPFIKYIQNSSEDGERTTKQGLNKYQAVYRKKVLH